ncbi:MAG: hypothetical protein M3178_10590 [Pseudomonadota bacterium]|nr:hypothetical protein [Pseudomonadota bacterium]
MARWKPSSKQIAVVIDCEVARVPLDRAAALLGVKPRTLRGFLKRLAAARVQKAISSGTVGSLTAKSARPTQSGISAPEGRPGGAPA